jgi:hypothetical protein
MGREGIGLGDWEGTVWDYLGLYEGLGVCQCLKVPGCLVCLVQYSIIGIPQKASTHTITIRTVTYQYHTSIYYTYSTLYI